MDFCKALMIKHEVFPPTKGRMATAKRMNCRKSCKSGRGGHFKSKKLYCRLIFKQGFLSMKFKHLKGQL